MSTRSNLISNGTAEAKIYFREHGAVSRYLDTAASHNHPLPLALRPTSTKWRILEEKKG
jgi:hypothetical protein